MSDDFPKRNSRSISISILIVVILSVLYMVLVVGIFTEEPEEPEGIIVRFILFIKQNMLI